MTVDVLTLAIGVLSFLGLVCLFMAAGAIRDYLHSEDFEFSDERKRIDAITELNRRRRAG